MLVFRINDMTCGHCVATIEGAIKKAAPEAAVSIDLAQHLVQVQGAGNALAIEEAIRAAGYSAQAV